MNKLERLAYWKKIVGDESARPWTNEEDDLFGYFGLFRPDGQGVEKVFEGVERGDEVLARLLPFYYYTKQGAGQEFIVRKPRANTHAELLAIMTQYLEKIRQIAVAFDASRLVTVLGSLQIEIKRGAAPPHSASLEPNSTYIHEIETDWLLSLERFPSEVILLKEAFYSVACDSELMRYLMWPIYRQATPIEDPFAPAFELWIRGAEYRFTNDKLLTVYAPSLTT